MHDISPKDFAHMTSEEMASPQRKQENIRLRRNSLTQTVGINEMRPYSPPEEDVPGEPGQDEMGRSGQPGVEYQRPV
jgi:Transcription factor S-II (TFIIS), central domain